MSVELFLARFLMIFLFLILECIREILNPLLNPFLLIAFNFLSVSCFCYLSFCKSRLVELIAVERDYSVLFLFCVRVYLKNRESQNWCPRGTDIPSVLQSCHILGLGDRETARDEEERNRRERERGKE